MDILTRPGAIASWAPIPFEVEGLKGDRLQAGSRAKVAGSLAGKELEFDVRVHQADCCNLRLTAVGPFVEMDVEYGIEGLDEWAQVRASIDVKGVAAVALGIAALTFAVDRGDTWGWTSAATLGTFAVGALMLVAFVAIERRARFPLVELSLFRNTPYVVITLAGMVSNICFCVTTFAITIYLQEVRGLSPILAGVVFLAPSLTLAVMGPLSGRLGPRFRPIGLMATAIGAGSIGLLILSGAHAWLLFVPAFALFGAGLGFGWSFVSVATQTVVKPERAGEASGVTLTIVVAVAGLCVATAATLLEVLEAGGATAGEANEQLLQWTAIGALAVSAALFAFQWLSAPRAQAEAAA